MSYILDALKKLEHEKIRKARGNGMSSITGELFSNDEQRTDGGGMGKILLIVVFVALVTFGASWFFLKPGKRTEIAKPGAPVAQQQAAAPAGVQTATSIVRPVAQPVAAQVPLPPPTVVTVAPKPPVLNKEDVAAQVTPRELRKRVKAAQQQPAPTMATPAGIQLSGIAWQDDRRARRAVINGFLVQEGAIISGSKVTEILQDRVRFTLSGSTFEIPLAISADLPPMGK